MTTTTLLALALLLPGDPDPRTAALEEVARAWHASGRFQGTVVVAEEGRVLYRGAFGDEDRERGIANAPDTRMRMGSIGKQFTAAAVMLLHQDGAVDLQAPASTYLPGFDGEAGEATLHQLLTHTSGLPRSVLAFTGGSIRRTYSPAELERAIEKAKREHPVGEYHYSNLGYTLLAIVVSKVSGVSFDDFVRTRILEPAGLVETHFDHRGAEMPRKAVGYEHRLPRELGEADFVDMSFGLGAGHYRTTVDDFVRWDRALAGDALLSAESQRLSWSPELHDGYGYGWGIGTYLRADGTTGTRLGHDGGIDGFSTSFARFVEDGWAIAVLANLSRAPASTVVDDLLRVLAGMPVTPAAEPLAWKAYDALVEGGLEAGLEACRGKDRNAKGPAYAAAQAAGPPDSVDATTYGWCWFAADRDGSDQLELTWEEPVTAHAIHVRGTARQGGLTRVSMPGEADGEWLPLEYEVTRMPLIGAGLGLTELALAEPVPTDRLRLEVDNSLVPGTNVVDAVALVRAAGEPVWASAASAGTERRGRYVGAPPENELNDLGYTLLRASRTKEALLVFRLNATVRPDAWNAHDSLGECLARLGRKKEAIESYERSLELNPDNAVGERALERLRGR